MPDLTLLIAEANHGNPRAAAELFPLVYDELRRMAEKKMALEAPGHTLNGTALVHEAFMRLVGNQVFEGRGHFFAAAGEAMRRILVNHARDRKRLKRGGGAPRLELLDQAQALAQDPDLVLSVDEILARISAEDSASAEIATLHLFAGFSIEEAASALGLSRATAYRNWKFARACLREALKKESGKS